jgi:hypothetical protein
MAFPAHKTFLFATGDANANKISGFYDVEYAHFDPESRNTKFRRNGGIHLQKWSKMLYGTPVSFSIILLAPYFFF